MSLRSHADDLEVRQPLRAPGSYFRPNPTIIGPGDDILLPTQSQRVTAEAEPAVVIGKTCRDVAPDEAESIVFGFTKSTGPTSTAPRWAGGSPSASPSTTPLAYARRCRAAPRRVGRTHALLRSFVRDGKLLRLPGQLGRRREVLRHLALATFEPGRRYAEPAVNDALRVWADGSGTDHVALRRYLIELNVLARAAGQYWLREDLDENTSG